MSIVMLLLVLAVIGVVAWALTTYVPMPQAVKTVIIVVAVIACVLYAFSAMGIKVPSPVVPQIK